MKGGTVTRERGSLSHLVVHPPFPLPSPQPAAAYALLSTWLSGRDYPPYAPPPPPAPTTLPLSLAFASDLVV